MDNFENLVLIVDEIIDEGYLFNFVKARCLIYLALLSLLNMSQLLPEQP